MSARDDHARGVRALRGGLAASSATFVALMSHLAGGGQLPGALGIVVPLALSLPVCIAWSGRLSLPGLSASVAASQLFFHVLFLLGTPAGAAHAPSAATHAGPAGQAGHAGHAGHAGLAATPGQAAGAAGQTADLAHTDAAMWAWHAAAAVVTIVVLHRGELMLLRLRALALRMAAWLLGGRAVVETAGGFVLPDLPGVVAETFRRLHPALQLSPLLRRGPPAPHAV